MLHLSSNFHIVYEGNSARELIVVSDLMNRSVSVLHLLSCQPNYPSC
jgi:hypothetical protein